MPGEQHRRDLQKHARPKLWKPLTPSLCPCAPQVHTSPKACARYYPAREHQGMLWVWPQLGAKAAALADATPLPTVPQNNDPSFSISDGQCDLGYRCIYSSCLCVPAEARTGRTCFREGSLGPLRREADSCRVEPVSSTSSARISLLPVPVLDSSRFSICNPSGTSPACPVAGLAATSTWWRIWRTLRTSLLRTTRSW